MVHCDNKILCFFGYPHFARAGGIGTRANGWIVGCFRYERDKSTSSISTLIYYELDVVFFVSAFHAALPPLMALL